MIRPGIYAPNKKIVESYYSKDYYDPKPPQCKVYEDVLLEPLKTVKAGPQFGSAAKAFIGGVCHEDGQFIAGFYRNPNIRDGNRYIFDSYKVEKEEITHLKGEYIYGGVIIFKAYGHLIADDMARLWYTVKHASSTAKIFFFAEDNKFPTETIEKIFWNIIDLLNIDRERVFIVTKVFKADKVYVPDQSFATYGTYNDEVLTTYHAIADAALAKSPDGKEYNPKIYLTRTKLADKNCLNEKYFEEFYSKRGYDIIAPETLPFEEQVRIFANAEHIVSTFGSLAIPRVFSKNLKSVTLLLRDGCSEYFYHHGEAVWMQLTNVKCDLVDVSLNYLPTVHTSGSHLLGPTKYWREYLDANSISYSEDEMQMDWSLISEFFDRYLELYSTSPYSFSAISNCDIFDVLNRVSLMKTGVPLNRNNFKCKSKSDYDKDIKKLNDDIAALKSTNAEMTDKLRRADRRLEMSAAHIPDDLSVVDVPKKKAKVLTVNCSKNLVRNGDNYDIDSVYGKITKKYSAVNKQWDYLLAIPYVHICEHGYDMAFFAPEGCDISLSTADTAKLNASSVDAVFDSVTYLDDSIAKTVTDSHGEEFYDLILSAIEKCCPQYSEKTKVIFEGREMYSIDTFIMKKDCFADCAEWLLPVLNEISANITSKEMPALRMVAQMLLTLYFSVNKAMYKVGVLG